MVFVSLWCGCNGWPFRHERRKYGARLLDVGVRWHVRAGNSWKFNTRGLLTNLDSIAIRLKAIASRLKVIASRSAALRLEAIASTFHAIIQQSWPSTSKRGAPHWRPGTIEDGGDRGWAFTKAPQVGNRVPSGGPDEETSLPKGALGGWDLGAAPISWCGVITKPSGPHGMCRAPGSYAR